MKDLQKQFDAILSLVLIRVKPVLKHHVFIVIILTLLVMMVAVFRVNQQLQQPSDEAYRQQQESAGIRTTFDQTTINRIKQLRRGGEGGAVDLGNRNRFSPFIE